MKTQLTAAMLFLLLAAHPAIAGNRLSIRLVKASNTEGGSAAGLSDVIKTLADSLPYKHFSLVASGTMPLPARGSVQQLGGYTVECDGAQSKLSIKVKRRGKTVLRKSANLPDGTHLIVGGFPAADGKLILVFVAK